MSDCNVQDSDFFPLTFYTYCSNDTVFGVDIRAVMTKPTVTAVGSGTQATYWNDNRNENSANSALSTKSAAATEPTVMPDTTSEQILTNYRSFPFPDDAATRNARSSHQAKQITTPSSSESTDSDVRPVHVTPELETQTPPVDIEGPTGNDLFRGTSSHVADGARRETFSMSAASVPIVFSYLSRLNFTEATDVPWPVNEKHTSSSPQAGLLDDLSSDQAENRSTKSTSTSITFGQSHGDVQPQYSITSRLPDRQMQMDSESSSSSSSPVAVSLEIMIY